MADATPSPPGTDNELDQPHYVSFILRCRKTGKGQVYARLIEVHSGVSHLVADPDSLPELVRQLVIHYRSPIPNKEGIQ